MHDDVLEEAAKLVYESWAACPGWVPWVPNGNSSKQDEARGVAARILRIRDLYTDAPKVGDQKQPSYPILPFTIGDAPIRYFSAMPSNEYVCANCGQARVLHIYDKCPIQVMLCSGE